MRVSSPHPPSGSQGTGTLLPERSARPCRRFVPWGGWRRLGKRAVSTEPPPGGAVVLSLARSRRLRRNAPAVALWFLLLYALSQLAIGLLMHRCRPVPFEIVRRVKERQIRELAARAPNRPLVVVLGSSRVDQGFQAGRLAGLPGPDGRPLLAYNFGVPATGAAHELLYLHELLDAGIRPRLLLVEFVRPLLGVPRRGMISEEEWMSAPWSRPDRLARLWPYLERPRRKAYEWLEARLAPAYTFHADMDIWLQKTLYPERFPRDQSYDQDEWGCRWPESLTDEDCATRLRLCRLQYAATLAQMQPGDASRRALHDLLACCRREGIPVALLVMPESSTFRSWYSPQGWAESERLLAELRDTHGVEVIDANRWIDDRAFSDGHHLRADGATRFTTRLIGEIQRLLRQ